MLTLTWPVSKSGGAVAASANSATPLGSAEIEALADEAARLCGPGSLVDRLTGSRLRSRGQSRRR
jgi:hypothetical protein